MPRARRSASLSPAVRIRAEPDTEIGITPLADAASSGDDREIRRLLTAGHDPNQAYDPRQPAETRTGGWTPLHHACASTYVGSGVPACVRLLLAAGADPDGCPSDGPADPVRPLAILLASGPCHGPAPIRSLLDAGASPVARLSGPDGTVDKAIVALRNVRHPRAGALAWLIGVVAGRDMGETMMDAETTAWIATADAGDRTLVVLAGIGGRS